MLIYAMAIIAGTQEVAVDALEIAGHDMPDLLANLACRHVAIAGRSRRGDTVTSAEGVGTNSWWFVGQLVGTFMGHWSALI
jgi:hypothetical protein